MVELHAGRFEHAENLDRNIRRFGLEQGVRGHAPQP